MAEQKCVCGHVWGDPVPTNCRVLRADGFFYGSQEPVLPIYGVYGLVWDGVVPTKEGVPVADYD